MEQKKLNKLLIDQYVAAGSQGTTPEILSSLAGHFCDKIRARVAANPATPIANLSSLAKDSNLDVRFSVATNASAPRSLQNQLARDGDPVLRYELACDIDTPVWMLEVLAGDKTAWVQSEALKTLSIVAPGILNRTGAVTYKTSRPCIDICNPWWRKTILNHF